MASFHVVSLTAASDSLLELWPERAVRT